jgi:hypothetical protein
MWSCMNNLDSHSSCYTWTSLLVVVGEQKDDHEEEEDLAGDGEASHN